MDWLAFMANVVQVIGGIWALVFGGKAVHEIVRLLAAKRFPRLRPLTITNVLLALILLVLISPFSHWPPVAQSSHEPSPTRSTGVSAPSQQVPSGQPTGVSTPSQQVPVQLQQMLKNFCNAITNHSYSYAYKQFVTLANDLQQQLQSQKVFERYTVCIPIDPRKVAERVHMSSKDEAFCMLQLKDQQSQLVSVYLRLYNENDWKIYGWQS